MSAYYYLRIIRVMFLQPPPSEERIPSSLAPQVALTVAGAATLWMGIAPGIILAAAESAVGALSGVTLR